MADIGYVALSMAFVLAAYAAVASLIAVRSGQGDLWLSARNAVWAALALTSVASAALVYALATRDFSLRYVAEYTSRDLSMPLTLSAWWAGQAGSLLFWSWLLAVFAGVVLIQNRRQNKELTPYTVAVIMAVLAFFLGIVIFAANPFEKLPATPADGLGLNPLLQNRGMLYHPPTLYLGYVGFTVPYAYAMAALMSGRLGNEWIQRQPALGPLRLALPGGGQPPGRPVGLHGPGLGRLLGLGPGGERQPDALADGHRLPALG